MNKFDDYFLKKVLSDAHKASDDGYADSALKFIRIYEEYADLHEKEIPTKELERLKKKAQPQPTVLRECNASMARRGHPPLKVDDHSLLEEYETHLKEYNEKKAKDNAPVSSDKYDFTHIEAPGRKKKKEIC